MIDVGCLISCVFLYVLVGNAVGFCWWLRLIDSKPLVRSSVFGYTIICIQWMVISIRTCVCMCLACFCVVRI